MKLNLSLILAASAASVSLATTTTQHIRRLDDPPGTSAEGAGGADGGAAGARRGKSGKDGRSGGGGLFDPDFQCQNGIKPRTWKSQAECCPVSSASYNILLSICYSFTTTLTCSSFNYNIFLQCINEENCIAILGDDPLNKECHRGDDCYSTAFNYPESKKCEAELHVTDTRWMDDTDACLYFGLFTDPDQLEPPYREEFDTFVVSEECTDSFLPTYVLADCYYEVDYTFYEACLCQGFGECDGGCGTITRRHRSLNVADENRPHRRHITQKEDGVSVHVESQHDERLLWLTEHVGEMKQRMETKDAARAWDPLFKAYFDNVKDINLECNSSDQDVRCTSTGNSQCALDLIQAHASYHNEIATSIQEKGSHTIKSAHAIPDSCK